MIFQGIWSSITKKPYIFVIFQGGQNPVPPSGSAHEGYLREKSKVNHKRNHISPTQFISGIIQIITYACQLCSTVHPLSGLSQPFLGMGSGPWNREN